MADYVQLVTKTVFSLGGGVRVAAPETFFAKPGQIFVCVDIVGRRIFG